jgi:hypothetical protein
MSTTDTSPSNNGRGSEAWSRSWTHFGVDRRSRGYCRVTFDHPPINTITATTVAELAELVGLIEQDADLNVVVFDSANPDFHLAHYDTENDRAGPRHCPQVRPECTRGSISSCVCRVPRWSASPRVRVRQPRDRRRPAGRRGRGHRLTTRALRSRRDRARQVLRRPGDVAPRQRVSAPLADFFQMLGLRRQQEQFARLQALGLNTDSGLERSLGRRVVESLPDA